MHKQAIKEAIRQLPEKELKEILAFGFDLLQEKEALSDLHDLFDGFTDEESEEIRAELEAMKSGQLEASPLQAFLFGGR